MNYLEQLNAFFLKKEQDALSSRAQCLYWNLLGLNNRYRWAAWFCASGLILQGMTGLSRSQLAQARTELAEKGYLRYRAGGGGQTGRYHLEDLGALYRDEPCAPGETQTETQSDTQPGTQVDTQTDTQPGTQADTQTDTRPDTQVDTRPEREAAPLLKIKTKEKQRQREPIGARTAEPSEEEVRAFVSQAGYQVDPALFTTYYQARGWQAGGQPIRSWQALVKVWDRRDAKGQFGAPYNRGNPALRYAQRAPAERAALDAVVQY